MGKADCEYSGAALSIEEEGWDLFLREEEKEVRATMTCARGKRGEKAKWRRDFGGEVVEGRRGRGVGTYRGGSAWGESRPSWGDGEADAERKGMRGTVDGREHRDRKQNQRRVEKAEGRGGEERVCSRS